jgi:hypothetical protein
VSIKLSCDPERVGLGLLIARALQAQEELALVSALPGGSLLVALGHVHHGRAVEPVLKRCSVHCIHFRGKPNNKDLRRFSPVNEDQRERENSAQ